jgi:hypothetical protein
MSKYNLTELGITEEILFNGLNHSYPGQYSYKYDPENLNIIYLSSKDNKYAEMPPIQNLIDAYNEKINQYNIKINKAIENKNRIHHHIDQDIINKIPVENYEYIQFINDLKIYKYNCHSHSKQSIFCIPDSSQTLINCCDENCINVNNLIGIMLTNIKYLNEQIAALKKI